MDYIVVPGVSFIIPSKMNPISFKDSLFACSIIVFIFSVNYIWFRHTVRKSDLEKLSVIIEEVGETRQEIDSIVLKNIKSKREGNNSLDITAQLSDLQTKIHAIEKNLSRSNASFIGIFAFRPRCCMLNISLNSCNCVGSFSSILSTEAGYLSNS